SASRWTAPAWQNWGRTSAWWGQPYRRRLATARCGIPHGSAEYDINIKLDAFDRNALSDIANLTLMNKRASSSTHPGLPPSGNTRPGRVERLNRIPSVTVKSKVLGQSSGTVGAALQQWVTKTRRLPALKSITKETFAANRVLWQLGTAFLVVVHFVHLIWWRCTTLTCIPL
ncbi:MAG: efflux RND transporter permease subunit, partial [Saprospiraceae bacterium]|nr:efflux RND transporter permease subunit [Saprospiraceae bacterium]